MAKVSSEWVLERIKEITSWRGLTIISVLSFLIFSSEHSFILRSRSCSAHFFIRLCTFCSSSCSRLRRCSRTLNVQILIIMIVAISIFHRNSTHLELTSLDWPTILSREWRLWFAGAKAPFPPEARRSVCEVRRPTPGLRSLPNCWRFRTVWPSVLLSTPIFCSPPAQRENTNQDLSLGLSEEMITWSIGNDDCRLQSHKNGRSRKKRESGNSKSSSVKIRTKSGSKIYEKIYKNWILTPISLLILAWATMCACLVDEVSSSTSASSLVYSVSDLFSSLTRSLVATS